MNKQQAAELSEVFFKSSVVVDAPIDTSRAVIPAPRTTDEIIRDEIHYHVSTMTAQLRTELHAEIEKTQIELDALRSEREAIEIQRKTLDNECAAISDARQLLSSELQRTRYDREQMSRLYNRVCVASGLCTPSRQQITGRYNR